ncbi:MAG: 50S ribosomal protein L25/general stress protein Ctc [Candidatus Eisenbacteria bacterium]
MSSLIQLSGTRRETLGKGGARKARAAGQLPGVVYGHGEEPVAVAVDYREFMTQMRKHKGGNPIVNLNLGGNEVTALVRDAQIDPISQAVLHVDFQHISLTEKVTVEVPVHAVGLALGVKDGGGILEMITRTVEIRCLPTAIPASIDVDVTALNVGQSLHVSDVKVEGIEILSDPETTLILVAAPTVEAETPAEGAASSEPEVVGAKGKKEEAGEEKKK